ncbi:D-hexose-6-phosphate mutarotase [Thiohalorhabdus sp.]|uniref:D-hexose-6-phosphate mutarotase n=1 Tax=Thiohalorhabdus sp. TaxID=3094134 RepID=UPI002FC377EC
MIDDLNQRFSHPDVRFYQHDQLVMVELSNDHGTATLTPFGATLLSYVPRGGEEVIWVSETARYDGAKPVRGGVPVCWPWFGPHDPEQIGTDPTDANKKAHGIARYETWEVESVRSVDAGTEVTFRLEPNEAIRQAWPHDFLLRLVVTLGERLEMALIGENRSDRDWMVSEALHTYFRVAEAPGMQVDGLEGHAYADRVADARRTQEGPLQVATPMDCVYLHHEGAATLHDAGNGRQIAVAKAGSASTIVWNPGLEGAQGFGDMPDEDYVHMVCVEAGNALDDAYTLPAGANHTLKAWIGVR